MQLSCVFKEKENEKEKQKEEVNCITGKEKREQWTTYWKQRKHWCETVWQFL